MGIIVTMEISLSFLQTFLRQKRMVGSVLPSSSFLAEKMLSEVDFSSARLVVEFGPGNGVFTKRILERMHPEAMLLIYELNETFFEKLEANIQDPRVTLINGSAESILAYAKAHDLGEVDCIISSLPLTNFSETLIENILHASKTALKPSGKFIQFQYTPTRYKHLKKSFNSLDIGFTALNIPPAFIFTCTK